MVQKRQGWRVLAHRPQYLAVLFARETGLELGECQLLKIGLGGAGRSDRSDLNSGRAVDRADLHGLTDDRELEVDLAPGAMLDHLLRARSGIQERAACDCGTAGSGVRSRALDRVRMKCRST